MNAFGPTTLLCLSLCLVSLSSVTSATTLEDILSNSKLRNGERDRELPLSSYGLAVRPDGRLVIVRDIANGRSYNLQKKFDSLGGGTFGLQKREVNLEALEKS